MEGATDFPGGRSFPETSWTLIRSCQDPASPAYKRELDRLITAYYKPIYAYVYYGWARRDVETARDLTQSFFASLLETSALVAVDERKGSFRSFVRACLAHFLAKWKEHESAQKRKAPGCAHEIETGSDPPDPTGMTPERAFLVKWRVAVLDDVLAALRRRAEDEGWLDMLQLFERRDVEGDRSKTYAELAEERGWTEAQVRNGLHRVRTRFRAAVRERLLVEVGSEDDLEEELRLLLSV